MHCVFVVWGEVGEALGVAIARKAGRAACVAVVWSPLFPRIVILKTVLSPVCLHACYYRGNNMEAGLGLLQSRTNTKLTLLNCNLICIFEIQRFVGFLSICETFKGTPNSSIHICAQWWFSC